MARVIIVDDSKVSRMLLATLLQNAGHTVEAEATNGSDGYEACKLQQPDIITLDVGMPAMDGITCLKMIKADFPAVKVIMISSASEKEKIFEALDMGADYYILKPFDAKFVADAVAKVLTGTYPPPADMLKREKTRLEEALLRDRSPFSLLSANDYFNITITDFFTVGHLPALRGAMRAIDMKPLRLKVFVQNPDSFDPDALIALLDLLRKVRERGGKTELYDGNGKSLTMSKEERQSLIEDLALEDR